MKLKYETGIATLIQFVTLSFLGIANGLDSIVSTCRTTGEDCISNFIVSILFFILTVGSFGAIWVLGYAAQERRSKRLAQILILAELFIGLIALFNAKHHTNAIGLATSVLDLLLAIWVITLAFRLMRASGGRVVKKQRGARKRSKSD